MESHVLNDPELSFKSVLKRHQEKESKNNSETEPVNDESGKNKSDEVPEKTVPPLRINLLNLQQVIYFHRVSENIHLTLEVQLLNTYLIHKKCLRCRVKSFCYLKNDLIVQIVCI